MKQKQLAYLFICNLIPLFVGMGLFPLLPLYTARFGATPTMVGICYAVTYTASLAGVVVAGWLGERIPLKVLFVAGSALGTPALALLGLASALWHIMILMALVWFCGTLAITLTNVLTGLIADGKSRGASFSLMSMAYPLGGVLGGAAIGQLVAWRGYPLMFATLAVVWVALPLAGLLVLQEPVRPSGAARSAPGRAPARIGGAFYPLLLAALISAIAISLGRLGTALSMQMLSFAPDAVASTAIVSGLVAAPTALLMGALSDRVGYARCLFLGYALAVGGALTLMFAAQLWHFWLAATLLSVAWSSTCGAA